MSGFFLVSRNLVEPDHDLHPMSTGETACRAFAWVDLIGMARWRPGNGLERGQLRASHRFLASRWNWSKRKVGRFMAELEEEGRVANVPTPSPREPSVISICNYEAYQDQFFGDAPPSRPANVRRGVVRGAPKKNTEVTTTSSSKRAREAGPFEELLPGSPAVEVLRAMEHKGTAMGTAATLRTSFLYDDPTAANPDPSVKGRDPPERRDLVERALLEMQDQGIETWSARALAGYIRRLKRGGSNGRADDSGATGQGGGEAGKNPFGDPSRRTGHSGNAA